MSSPRWDPKDLPEQPGEKMSEENPFSPSENEDNSEYMTVLQGKFLAKSILALTEQMEKIVTGCMIVAKAGAADRAKIQELEEELNKVKKTAEDFKKLTQYN